MSEQNDTLTCFELLIYQLDSDKYKIIQLIMYYD